MYTTHFNKVTRPASLHAGCSGLLPNPTKGQVVLQQSSVFAHKKIRADKLKLWGDCQKKLCSSTNRIWKLRCETFSTPADSKPHSHEGFFPPLSVQQNRKRNSLERTLWNGLIEKQDIERVFFSLTLQYSVLVLNFVSPSGLMLKDWRQCSSPIRRGLTVAQQTQCSTFSVFVRGIKHFAFQKPHLPSRVQFQGNYDSALLMMRDFKLLDVL